MSPLHPTSLLVSFLIHLYPRKPRNFAFVEFRTIEEAQDALEHLNGKECLGYKMDVQFAREKRKTADEMRRRYRHAFSFSRSFLEAEKAIPATTALPQEDTATTPPVRIDTTDIVIILTAVIVVIPADATTAIVLTTVTVLTSADALTIAIVLTSADALTIVIILTIVIARMTASALMNAAIPLPDARNVPEAVLWTRMRTDPCPRSIPILLSAALPLALLLIIPLKLPLAPLPALVLLLMITTKSFPSKQRTILRLIMKETFF